MEKKEVSGGKVKVAFLGDSVASQVVEKVGNSLKEKLANYTAWGLEAADVAPRADQTMEKIQKQSHANVLLLSLGGDDLMNGRSLPAVRKDLTAIIDAAHKHGMAVAMVELDPKDINKDVVRTAAREFGPAYVNGIKPMYDQVARQNGIDCHVDPSLYKDVHDPNLLDQIHPNAQGENIIAKRIGNVLKNVVSGNIVHSCPAEPVALKTPATPGQSSSQHR